MKADQKPITSTEARAGRIVKGGAIRRILWVSISLAVIAMVLTYLFILE